MFASIRMYDGVTDVAAVGKGALSCRSIPSILNQDVEHDTMLVDRPPEIVQLAIDPYEHFVQVPDTARPRTASAQSLGELHTEFPAPPADALVGDAHTALGQDEFDIP